MSNVIDNVLFNISLQTQQMVDSFSTGTVSYLTINLILSHTIEEKIFAHPEEDIRQTYTTKEHLFQWQIIYEQTHLPSAFQ